MKNITVLGVTGSIGMQTVDVVKNHLDKFKIVAMSAGYNIKQVEEILLPEFAPHDWPQEDQEDPRNRAN